MNDYIGGLNKRQFVIDQLHMYGGQKKLGDESSFVLCPYHSEKTPSGRIFHSSTSTNPGHYKCYGCGQSVTWNDVAPKLGLQPYGAQKPKDEYATLNVLQLDDAETEEEIKFSDLPKNKMWRGIETSLLIDLGAKFCRVRTEWGWSKPKIWLPIYVNSELKGYIKARIKKHAEYPSYINSKGVWSKTHGLFPYDYSVQLMNKIGSRTLVLVEGPRDALILLSRGIPAISILGTQSFTEIKARILELSEAEKLILMMDGDCAGIMATKKIYKLTRDLFDVRVVKLWDLKGSPYRKFKDHDEPSKHAKEEGVSLWDPASCPQWVLDKVKDRL